jgi:hypothetical protein
MVTHTTHPHGRYLYHYYSCAKRRDFRGKGPCRQKALRAEHVEPVVWEFVSGLLKDPERIRAGMAALIEREWEAGSRDTGQEATAWASKLEEYDRLRSAYQDQQALGFMSLAELGSKLNDLEETRKLARAELAALKAREEHVRELEADRDALIESWFARVPEDLDGLTGNQRNRVYRMLRLKVTPVEKGYKVTGAFSGVLWSGSDGEEAKRSEVEDPFAAHRGGPGYRSGHDRAYQQLVEALLFEVRRVYDQGRSSLGSYSRDTIQKACVTRRPRGPRPPVPSPAISASQGKAGQPFSYFADQPSG